MFIVVGPGSPSLLSNVLVSTEEPLDWLGQLVDKLRREQIAEFEATHEAERDWVAHVNERAQETLYPTANSFYNGAEIAGKPRVFMPYSGGVRQYRRLLQQCAAEGYKGFVLRAASDSSPRRHMG
jgi:cyclohexanone monooxygenase